MPTLLCFNGSYPGSSVVGSVGSWMVRQAVVVGESWLWPLSSASHGFPCPYLFYRFIIVPYDSQPNANKATYSAETHNSRSVLERHSAHRSLHLRSITFCRVDYQWSLSSLQSDPDNLTLNRKNSEKALLNVYAAHTTAPFERPASTLLDDDSHSANSYSLPLPYT
uniref:Uncharacterized protein n=1 Tax=Glossina austeni TaxID=7395 RepID=A0A1A9VIQ5_GLOAU